MGLTIAATAAALNTHYRVFDTKIQQDLRVGLVTEGHMTPVRTHRDYVAENMSTTELIQAYQWQYTPKGDQTHDEVLNSLQRLKVDVRFTAEDLDKYFDSWHAEWVEQGKSMKEWSFPKFIVDTVINPKIQEELELSLAFSGSYAAPTPGTAGVTINSADGLGTKIAAAILAGDITPIATGALTTGTIVAQVEAFVDSLPIAYRNAPGKLFMSNTWARAFWRNYRANFGTGNGVLGNENNMMMIDGTNIQVVGLPSMEGSSRIIFNATQTKNLIYGYKIGESPLPVIRWQEDERVLKGLAEFSRFWGWKHHGHLFVNDQA